MQDGIICGLGTEGLYFGIKSFYRFVKKMKIDKKLIKELVNCLSEFNITEIEYQDGDKKIKVSKAQKSSSEKM